MSAPLLTPGSGGAKPKPEPQKPIVPLVVYTAFDAQTAEELKKRLTTMSAKASSFTTWKRKRRCSCAMATDTP